jgi:hypothetical protein
MFFLLSVGLPGVIANSFHLETDKSPLENVGRQMRGLDRAYENEELLMSLPMKKIAQYVVAQYVFAKINA